MHGILTYKDGSSATSRFNINQLINDIQFINQKGDTLVLTDKQTIDNLRIDDHLYYFKEGAIEIIKNYKVLRLGVCKKIVVKTRDQRGAYGESLATNSVINTGTLVFSDKAFTLLQNDDLVLKRTVDYYFIKEDQRMILPATKRNLYKAFRETNDKVLSDYLNNNSINFKQIEDLYKLLSFCEKLIESK